MVDPSAYPASQAALQAAPLADPQAAPRAGRGRIRVIDIARGVALVAMAIYHFTWDLEFFGHLEPGLTAVGGWKIFARCIASSFLFLVGVSLVLAHARGVRWRPFLVRLAQVGAAAAAISLVTWFAVPNDFIFFGILHQIALASLLGVLLLRFPALVLLALGLMVISAPFFLRSELFASPWLWWVGLSPVNPRSNDYVPVFPWFGAVLLGMAAAKIFGQTGLLDRMRSWTPPRLFRPLEWGGQHSLGFYLLHQPVLIALVWLGSQIVPPTPPDPSVNFSRACQAQCLEVRNQAFCTAYCGCVLDRVEQLPGGVTAFNNAGDDAVLESKVQDIAAMCSAEADLELPQ